MTATIDPVELFNRKLRDFLDDISPLLGHLTDYKMFRASVNMLSSIDKKKNQEYFDEYVAKTYGDKIVAKDECFFLKQDYPGAQATCSDMSMVPLLKSVWGTMSDDDKSAVWSHLNVLIVLNNRCNVGKKSRR